MFKKKEEKQNNKKCECRDEIERLKKELEEAKKRADGNLVGWKRALADYANFKKGEEASRADFINFASTDLILEILPILDNFNAAWKTLPKDAGKNPWVIGFGHIKSQMENLLKERGVEEAGKVGEEFNPEGHEAVEKKLKAQNAKLKTTVQSSKLFVVEVVQKGYKLHGRVIRPAKVVVKINLQ